MFYNRYSQRDTYRWRTVAAKDIRELIHLLLQAGLQVEIETNGAVDLSAFCEERPVFTMDYKLPSSGCEEYMITENMELLGKDDTVKLYVAARKIC